MYEENSLVNVNFLGVLYKNCVVLSYEKNGGRKSGPILKVKTTTGIIIPFIGMTEGQEAWAFVVKSE